VKDDKLPRSSWKLGKILKLISSRDLKVRVAQIQLPGHSTITRAINYIFPLELKEVSPQLQPYKALQDGLNEELCLIILLCKFVCFENMMGLGIILIRVAARKRALLHDTR